MLIYDGETYLWNGTLSDLKCFVNDILNLKGKWTSPGGDVKLFSTADSGFLIKWFGLRSQKLVIQADDDDKYLHKKFESLVNRYESDHVGSGYVSGEAINGDETAQENTLKACGCIFSAELEGLKLDMTILESRILSAISQNERESHVGLLAVKLKEMKAVIRHQDEVIRALNDDNQFFKAKLLAFEKAFLGEDYNNSRYIPRATNNAVAYCISEQNNKSNLSLLNVDLPNASCVFNLNRRYDNKQCNADLNNNRIDLTNEVVFSPKQPLIPCEQSSVPQVNDNSLNDLNKNTFDYTNDVTLPPKQPLVSSQLPSAPQINDVSLTQPKNTDDKHQYENLNSQQNSQRTINRDGDKSEHASSIKSSIPCPFLIRRGRCFKGSRCDYKPAKSPQTHKRNIPCPFLQKRGYCLKKNMSDFFPIESSSNNPPSRPYPGCHAYPNPFFPYRQASVLRHTNIKTCFRRLVSKIVIIESLGEIYQSKIPR